MKKKTQQPKPEQKISELEKELVKKTRELEIEASLERVRTVAMSMNKSEDLLRICEVSFNEFQKLGFDHLRNAVIHIPNDDQNFYMDYDYSESLGSAIAKIDYGSHPIVDEILEKIRSSKDAFFEVLIGENQLKGWREFRKKSGQQEDPRLDDATALYYYLFSIGIGDIGISTFKPIDESQIKILKRFRNVFELAYRRFIDIQQAEAQAREAQIQLALERVRARTMAMQKSEELKEVIRVVYEQFVHLKINVDHAGFVVDYTPGGDWHFWIADEQDIPSKITHPYFDSVWASQFNEAKEKGADLFATNLNFEEKNKFYNELLSYVPGLPAASKDFYLSCPGLAGSTALFDNVSLYIENFSGTPYSDEDNKILMRFGKVFQQTYTRFLDLQKAELQAKEAQIEASLEKVRAVAMSMNKSEDLLSICEVSFKEFRKLGFYNIRNALIHIQYDEQKYFMDYDFSDLTGGAITKIEYGSHPIVEDYLQQIRTAKDAFYQGVIKECQLEEWKEFRRNSGQIDDPQLEKATALYYYFFSIGIGDIGISTLQPIDESQKNILKRFRNVFDLAYRRYSDIKQAEAQARESEIELALERVRARTMAMQKSEELREVIQLVYEQFGRLNIHIEHTGFILDYKSRDDLHIWLADKREMPSEITIPCFDSPPNNSIKEAKEKGQDFFSYLLTFEEKNKFYKELFKFIPGVPQESLEYYFNCPGLAGSGVLLENVGLYIENFSGNPYTDEENNTLMRFGKVFQQAYVRFLDLQKAEEQAREARIEASLEIVRSLALGMHKSEEVGKVTDRLFEELNKIILKIIGCTVVVIDENKDRWETWRARTKMAVKPLEVASYKRSVETMKKNIPGWFPEFYAGLGSKNSRLVKEMSGERRIQLLNSIAEQYGYSDKERARLLKITPEKFTAHFLFFKLGYLALITEEKLPEENLTVTRRFVEVFDFAYTRFLDIKRAEEQARESQIETALEKVRSRSLAMHHTSELQEVINTVHYQFKSLNIAITGGAFIAINEENKNEITCWGAGGTADYVERVQIPYYDRPIYTTWLNNIKKGPGFYTEEFSYDEKIELFNHLFKHPPYTDAPAERKKDVLSRQGGYTRSCFVSKYTSIFIINHHGRIFSEEENNILKRFGTVFEQTYTRFLDLQKAEAQAREAEIQLALERVRARTMAMHKSDELAETAAILFQQMTELGVTPERLNICLIKEEDNVLEVWATDQQGIKISHHFNASLDEPTTGKRVYDAWKEKKKSIVIDLSGKELNDWIRYVREVMGMTIKAELIREHRIHSVAFFSQGMILTTTPGPLPKESIKLLERFADVFNLTYTRFLDLQKAEAQAREAIKQASLDRVRGEIASMRTAEDLNRITPLIWRELKTLDVPFIRCGVFIIDEDNAVAQIYLTTPEGKSLGVLNLPFDANELTTNTVKYWRKKQVYKEFWDKQGFINWTKSMMELGQVRNAETYQGSSTPPESLYLHFIPFTQGMLYVGDVNPLTDEKLELVKTLAEAFSIAYARYEDFKNLEEAKNKIETTLSELKSAQAQLVHSEKMASLGELTAGIAHEIKNPLNFVNNFSEISSELIDEIEEELEKNDKEEVLEILKDLKQNLEKINQHGKSADSIVKGMLLHSRGTSGEKSLTDINDLLDQYVNLAYHGMRAQNKEFNITIEKNYDETLEKINVVPQDISRVFLNIINNACYAANEKKKKSGNDFSPILKVSTKKQNGKVEIRIADNGNGIPKDIIDKIYQPFFTTKPTGEGTGLGLSLSYDIVVKQHGGQLKVETTEGEGTEFMLILNI